MKEVVDLVANAKRGEEIRGAIEEGFEILDASVKNLTAIAAVQGIAIIILGITLIRK